MTTKTKRNTPPSSRDARNLPAHNARFARPAAVAESAFVRIADPAALTETLCVQEDRVVDRANTVSWGRLKLQLPQSPLRARFVKARVRVHEYPDGALAVFHGPRCITRYSARGEEISEVPTCIGLVTPCSPPSRTLRAAFGGGPRGPSLTAAALGVTGPMQVGTKKRPGRTPAETEQSMKMGFRTEFRTRFEQDGLSHWYSWVDSNHRPPDPQSGALTN